MLVFTPAANQVIETAAATRNCLIVAVLTDVADDLFAFSQESGRWRAHRFDLPAHSSVEIVDADEKAMIFSSPCRASCSRRRSMSRMLPRMTCAGLALMPCCPMRGTSLLAGASWMSEYGDPDHPAEGAFLRSISPYHAVKDGLNYPPALLLTSRADDRVHPGHARKMAARLEDAGAPVLFYESGSGGHGRVTTSLDAPDPLILEWVYFIQRLMG